MKCYACSLPEHKNHSEEMPCCVHSCGYYRSLKNNDEYVGPFVYDPITNDYLNKPESPGAIDSVPKTFSEEMSKGDIFFSNLTKKGMKENHKICMRHMPDMLSGEACCCVDKGCTLFGRCPKTYIKTIIKTNEKQPKPHRVRRVQNVCSMAGTKQSALQPSSSNKRKS